MGKAKCPDAKVLPAHPDTPPAENALIGVVYDLRVTVIYRQASPQFAQSFRPELYLQVVGNTL